MSSPDPSEVERSRPLGQRLRRRASWLAVSVASAVTTLLVAAAVMAAAVAVKAGLLAITDANAGFVIYVPALAVVAWYRGLLGGVVATMLGALVDTLVFVTPLLMIGINLGDARLQLLAYVVGGISVSYLSHRLRSERDRAQKESDERHRALEETARARQELARIVAVERRARELRDAFNSVISHELRTPITAIYGGAKLLARRDRVLEPSAREELLDDLEAEADRLYRLVEDLLVLSRSERGTIERAVHPVAVRRVVERVVASERTRWPGVRFETQTSATATARGDETYVEQVMRNLLSNAAKYSPAGSTVTAIVDETGEGVRVRVFDEGTGINPDETARLFELYYRSPDTSAKVSGAGIGLFVCRALIEAMGGRIWAAPHPGGGAEFGFILERYVEEATGAT